MTPKWATELMAQVLADEGWTEPVKLIWRRAGKQRIGWEIVAPWESGRARYGPRYGKRRERTGGVARAGSIIITAGTSRTDQKLVLLHELAHILTPKSHHGPDFWDKAWALYRRYGVPIRYAQKREYAYRKGAKEAYRRTRTATDGS